MKRAVLSLVIFLALAAAILAEEPFIFYGKFREKCEMGKDGLYYRDELTYVVCSHGNSYVQPCPDGTKNAEYNDFFHGKKYHYNQFCDVNLVDQTITTHAQPRSSFRPPNFSSGIKYGGQGGDTYGTNNRQQEEVVYTQQGYDGQRGQSAGTYGGAPYGSSNTQAAGYSGRTHQAGTRQGQHQGQFRYSSGPMTLEETYNTFFNGFDNRNQHPFNGNYRFRAYPRYN